MDVTEEILRNTMLYGASDNTAPGGLASSRALNYSSGGSITKPENTTVSFIPFTLNYQDSVGLFGTENRFVKVNVRLDLTAAGKCFEEFGWECARLSFGTDGTYYWTGVIDPLKDLTVVNEYEPARMTDGISERVNAYLSINLNNLKTGNKYIDAWFDTRLYTADREEHPYDKMYVRTNDFFYIGFHARNTKRLPYNVDCLIGNEYVSSDEMTDEDRRYIARRIR